jgi:hypothetical protein
MIVYQCKNCEGGPCTLIIEGLGDVPTHCPWGPEGFSEWYPMMNYPDRCWLVDKE